jgi:hypothetical protein
VCDNDLQSVVMSYVLKSSINPITNPNPIYSHAQSRDNIYKIAIRFMYYVLWIMIRINIQTVNTEYFFVKNQLN